MLKAEAAKIVGYDALDARWTIFYCACAELAIVSTSCVVISSLPTEISWSFFTTVSDTQNVKMAVCGTGKPRTRCSREYD